MSMPAIGMGPSVAATLSRLLPATRAGRLLTLIYHRVLPATDPMFPDEVTAGQFDLQMAMLKRFCSPISLSEAMEALRVGSLPPRAVAVTFDDGYRDNFTEALPILRRNGIPATFFVATSFLDGGIMWNDAIIESVRQAPVQRLSFPEFGLSVAEDGSDADRGRLAGQIILRIKHLHPDKRALHVNRVVEQCAATLPRNLMMDSSDVRGLHEAGMAVGAHTSTHPILCSLDLEAARDEISNSRERLRQIVGSEIVAFAYPNGRPGEDYGQRDRDMVESLGFHFAAATRRGVAGRTTDRFQLPRFMPWDRDPVRWIWRLLLTYRNHVKL